MNLLPPWKTFCLLSLLSLCLAACARLPVAPVADRPPVQSAPELLQQLADRAADIHSFKAKGNVSVVSPQKNYTGSALLTGSKPALLRVDLLNFFGQPVVAMLVSRQELKLLSYAEGRLYRGPANAANLGRFVPLSVSLPDFMALLTGRPAFELYEQPVLLASQDPQVNVLELTSRQDRSRVKLTLDSSSLNILQAQWVNPQGQEMLLAEFGDFVTQGTLTAPRDIQLASGDRVNQLRVRYRDLSFNVAASPEALELPVSGAVREMSFPP